MSVHPSPSPSRTSSYSNPPANGTSSIPPPPPPPPPFVPPSGPAPPPPSLREILGQFSEHGGGDRELLLSILSSKTAEEDRIASQMAYNSLLFSLTSGSYSSLLPPFGGPPSPAPSTASIPPLPPTAAQHSSSSVPFSLAPSSAPPNPNAAPLTSSSKSPRPTLNGSRSPSFNHPSSSSSSSTLHPPPPTITTTAAPSSSSPPPPGHQPQPNTLSPNGFTSPHPPPFVRRGSSTGSANGTVRKLGLLDLLGGSNVEGSGSGSGSVGLIEKREESFVRGSETAGAEGRVQGSPGVVETPKKRDADDGEEEMEVDEIDDD